MKVKGTATLQAPPDAVFSALVDPSVLVATIPGVQSLSQVGDDRYAMTVVAGVASVKGAYDGEVALHDRQPPTSFTLRARGSGAPGTVDATVRVTLSEQGTGTLVTYDADAVVGGMVGGVGQRMLAGVATRMAQQFFGNVDAVMTGALPVAPAEAAPAAGPSAAAPAVSRPAVLTAPGAASTGDVLVPWWAVLAGVASGAFWALAGVVVGYRVARSRR